MSAEYERDTHFQGAAQLLFKKMYNVPDVYIEIPDWSQGHENLQRLITHFLYDFMYFQIESRYQHRGTFHGEIHETIKIIPDMAEWPEQRS